MSQRVAVAGATGLVGRACVSALLGHAGRPRVMALARDPATAAFKPHPRLQVLATDFDRLDERPGPLAVDAVICALGTTIGKAGSQAAFRRVDVDYVLAIASHALAGGARHFVLVSALGADPQSRVFYNRSKGEVEQAVGALGYAAVTVLRPSLLLGERGEFRLGEEVAKRFAWLIPGRYAPVQAAAVAAVAVGAAVAPAQGLRVIESSAIR